MAAKLPATLGALMALWIAAMLQACSGASEAELLASAKTYLAQKDHKAAILQLKTALQQSPQSGEARYLLGKALLDSGDAVAASVELRKAADLKYDANLVAPTLARALLAEGDARRVAEAYAETVLTDPVAEADLKTSLARVYAGREQRELAEQALAAALKASPQFAPAKLMKARLAAAGKDYPAALALLGEITRDGGVPPPVQAEAWLLQAEVQQHGLGERDAAMASYRRAVALHDDLMPAHQALVGLLVQSRDLDGAARHVEALKKSHPRAAATQMLDAQMAFLRKDYAATRALAEPLLQLAPNNPLLLQMAGAAEFYLKSLPQAENLLAQAVKLEPGLPVATQLLARTYLRGGRPEKALEVLEPMVDAASPRAEVLMLAGEAHLQKGDAARAESLFARAARANPDDTRARTALALGKIGKGDAAAGLAELQDLAASDTGPVADMALVATYLRRNEVDRALKALDALEAKDPTRPMAANLRGRILVTRQDAAGARRNFEKALSLDPDYYPAISSLAALDMAERKPEAAHQRFEALVARDPKNFRALMALAALETRAGGSPQAVAAWLDKAVAAAPTEPGPRLQLVTHHLNFGDAKAALAAAQAATLVLPSNRELIALLGQVQLSGGDFQQALSSFNKLAAAAPDSPAASLGLAQANIGLKNYDVAERHLREALALSPRLVTAQSRLIGLMVDDDRPSEALALARQVQKQRPDEAVGYMLEGDIEQRRRAWDAALAAYRTALKKQPGAETALKVHSLLAAADRADEAERFAADWLKEHPRDAAFRFYLADRALARSDWPLAESRYRAVLDVQPDNVMAMNNVAWLLVKQSKPGALVLAEKADTLMPNQPQLRDTLALALAAENQVDKALELQHRTLQQRPDDPSLRLTLARLYLQAGHKAKARDELEALNRLGKSFSEHAEVVALLKSV